MPWNLSRWDEGDEQQNDWGLEIECAPGRILHFHGAQLQGPAFLRTPEEQRDFTLRRVCHMLIEHIERRGLEEVCQSLAEFYEYYRPTEASTHLLPAAETRDATVVTRSTRPAFVIEGE